MQPLGTLPWPKVPLCASSFLRNAFLYGESHFALFSPGSMVGRCWDGCGVEKVDASCKGGQRATSSQTNLGPRGQERSVRAGCKSF